MLLTAREYIRSFWWFAISTPLFGIFAVIFGTGFLQVIGLMAIFWPFSIPARAVLTTSKSSKLFTEGCWVEVSVDRLAFFGDKAEPKRLRMVVEPNAVRDLVDRGAFQLVRTRRLGFIPIRTAALEGKETEFREVFEEMLAKRDAEFTS